MAKTNKPSASFKKGSSALGKDVFSAASKKAKTQGNYSDPEPGTYLCRLTGVKNISETSNGDKLGVTFKYKIIDGDNAGLQFTKWMEYSEDKLSNILSELARYGYTVDEIESEDDLRKLLDELNDSKHIVRIRCAPQKEGDGVWKNVIKVLTDEEAEALEVEDATGDAVSDDTGETANTDGDNGGEDGSNDGGDATENDAQIEVGSTVTATYEEVNKKTKKKEEIVLTGEVKKIKGTEATVEFEDGSTDTWELEDLTLVTDDAGEGDGAGDGDGGSEDGGEAELEVGSKVSFEKDGKTLKGKVVKIDEDNGTANIKVGDKVHKDVDAGEIELID